MKITLECFWHDVGSIGIEDGKLRFPSVPDVPGAYRFELGSRLYLGETDRLRRRFQHYRTPGPTQHTNVRLNAVLLALLSEGGAVPVAVITEATVSIDGTPVALDLQAKSGRLLLESAALTVARAAGQAIENL